MIKTIFVVHRDGIPLLRVSLVEKKNDELEEFLELFGGVSSAINTLIMELGHKELRSVSVDEGALVYSSKGPMLFIIHTTEDADEPFAKLLIKQIEYDFIESYNHLFNDDEFFVHRDRFAPFESRIREIFTKLNTINQEYPELLEFLPTFVQLSQLYEILNIGLDLIKGYPEDTIKLARKIKDYFKEDDNQQKVIAKTLGKYSGHIIAKQTFKGEFVIDQQDVRELLREISVVKFDKKEEVFDITLCPICRNRTSETPMCHFFSGFIEGALDNPSITVQEISCRATGDKSCRFRLIRT
ncbi:MAG: hypothetical protein BAJATHORv1_20115 [Candidatus Thorarchaeota archaeon]|nr:MAG: hypothetical protein BAJATHORv1_20115 [Candidatus Thorarchaeota archaeon]